MRKPTLSELFTKAKAERDEYYRALVRVACSLGLKCREELSPADYAYEVAGLAERLVKDSATLQRQNRLLLSNLRIVARVFEEMDKGMAAEGMSRIVRVPAT